MRAVIIDDEKKARETIRSIIELYCPDVDLIGEADSVKTGIELINTQKPEIVFLDINLNDGSGFDLLKKVNGINFKTIFITAYEDHALKAFKFSALDYILKPVDPDDLTAAIEKAKSFQQHDNMNLKL
jgi:two-component system, LytTR family, response regulator